MSFLPSPRRLTAVAALGVAAVLACAAPASAAPADAAAWLSGPALTGGDHIVAQGFAQDGTSADAVYALAAAGDHLDAVAAIDAYLQANVATYADPDGTGDFPGPYSGSLAKLALVAETTSQDPHAYGGFDLLGVLADNVCTATAAGTCAAPGDFFQIYSSISQSLGVLALQRSPLDADHLTATSAPFTRLLGLRCTDGLFTGSLLAPGATCAAGDVDASAYAIQAVAAVLGADDPAVTTSLTALAARQDLATGGFLSSGPGATVNTNSTGVALSAFSVQPTAFATAVTAARDYIEARQQDNGAYAFTAADTSVDSAKLATPQGLLGALGRTLADPTLTVTLPTAPPTTPAPTTPPTTASPTTTTGSSAAAPTTGAAPELAATGVSNGHLTGQLIVGLLALVAGVGVLGLGARQLPRARHRG